MIRLIRRFDVFMREQTYHAIILKKQAYKEADEIITFFTKEQGKIRGLAKSVKSPKSKLQQKLQALFLVEVRLTLGKMPKIISAETVKVYHHLRENLQAMKTAFYATELTLKITADEQKNEVLFNLLQDFLQFLNDECQNSLRAKSRSANGAKDQTIGSPQGRTLLFNPESYPDRIIDLGLAKFKIGILEASGLGVPDRNDELFKKLKSSNFPEIPSLFGLPGIGPLQTFLSQFIENQLERKVNSEKYLKQENML